MDEAIIIRYEMVPLPKQHLLVLQVELNNGEMEDIGGCYDDEADECETLAYVGRTCKGQTIEETKQKLHDRRVELIRASAVIR